MAHRPPVRPDYIALAISALAAAVSIACAVSRAVARADAEPVAVAAPERLDSF